MAFSTRSSLFIFFTTLVLLSTQIQARDSFFFGKFHRESSKNPNNDLPLETSEKTAVGESIPNKHEQEQDPTFVPELGNGYGLYGHETSYNNKKEEFNNNYDDKVNSKTFSTPSLSETEESFNNYDKKYPKNTESYENNGYNNEEFNNNNNYNNNKYDENFKEEFNNNNNNEYQKNEFNNNNKYEENFKEEFNKNEYQKKEFNNNDNGNFKEESFPENNEDNKRGFYNSNTYGTELEQETPYKGYSHNLERQGMSDTRFMEKGNYYYDLYNDRNHGHYYKKTHTKSPAGYYTSPTTDTNYDQQSYSYGNNNNEERSFKDPYNSKWEKNLMDEQPEEFVEEQGTNQFKP